MTPLLWLLAGALPSALLVWLLLQSRQSVMKFRIQSASEEALRERQERLRLETALAEARTRLAASEADAAARLEELRAGRLRLQAEFGELSTKVLRASQEDFLKVATQSFDKLRQAAGGDLEARQQSIESLVKPLRETLGSMEGKITELERARSAAYGQLGAQLEQLHAAQLRLQGETGRLSNALSTTRTAGTWGEVQLRRVVELAGMVEHCDFVEQATPGDGGRERADLLVHLPGGQLIAVDAKAPTGAYREAAEVSEPSLRLEKLRSHAAAVARHCEDLASREYWKHFNPSPEFVVLFLPGDQFLAAALEADPAFMDRAIAKKVLPATPSTLVALLKAAAFGWRQEAVSQNAEYISTLGRQLHDRLATWSEHLSKLGKSLDASVKAYNASVGSLQSSVLPGARKLAELGAKGSKELPELQPGEVAVRELQ